LDILRVNMNEKKITREELPQELMLYGNRGLIGKILSKEVPATCEPLGRHNKLVFANGPLASVSISSSGRISAGAKSPLTGGIKEANSGGMVGFRLAKQGIRALIIEDKPENKDDLFILHIKKDVTELIDGNEYKMMGTHELAQKLFERYGKDCAISCIGPAGEMLMSSAGIVNTDMDQNPSRLSGRGGLGAVMGSKCIKAIVVENDGNYKMEIKDKDRYNAALKEYIHEIRNAHQTSVGYTLYGTAGIIPTISVMGAFPSYAFRKGSFEKADEISGERLRELILERGGEGTPTHACMPGCLIRCSNIFPDKSGKKVVASLEYETLCLCGSNLGISNLDDIAELNYLCNDYGLDSIETGATIGVYMDLGLADFGDAEAAKNLVKEIGKGTLLGKVLGEGSAITARIFKSLRAPVVKGQSMPAHEPRALKGMSVTYSTTPMGADHTAGVTTRAPMDQLDPNIWMEFSRNLQVKIAAFDTLGLCMFVTTAGPKIPGLAIEMLNGIYGTDYAPEYIETMGKDVVWTEKEFNTQAGFNEADDRMPEFMREEPFPPHNTVSDIPQEHYDRFWESSFWGK
jgi:aldehyde:ferredoxin oxidoreductase